MSPVLSQLASLAHGPVPEAVRSGIPCRVIDIVGIAVRAGLLDSSRAVMEYATDQGSVAQATAIGTEQAMSAADAAFVNGVLAHSLDYDDTHLPSILHPSATVVPAALAVAEWLGVSGAALVDAIAVGLEVTVRLGMGGYDPEARQSVYFERGQHATSICGSVGSAAAAARLLGADVSGIAHAMGIACSMASGIIEANRAGGTVKRIHCGWAARGGVVAAQLAAKGITGPSTAIEGRFGLFQAFLGEQSNLEAVTTDLGEHWQSQAIIYKPYPANHFTHTAIDAAIALRSRGVCPEEIHSVTVEVAPPTVRTIGEPIAAKRIPETGYQAQFSGPYTVATGLLGGGGLGVSLADFGEEQVRDSRRRELMDRIDVVGDPSLMDIYPFQLPARLTLTTVDGQTLVEEVLANRGGPDLPLSEQELAVKFFDNTEGLVANDVGQKTYHTLLELITIPCVTGLLDPLTKIEQTRE